MKLLQKTIKFFKPCSFDRIFATLNGEKNTTYIISDRSLFFRWFAC